jgi:hypothetical protein
MSVGSRPVWLDQETEIASVLSAAVDRFDRQPGDTRHRPVTVSVEKYLPSLVRTDVNADHSWGLIRRLERLGVLLVRHARNDPFDPEWKGAKLAFSADSEVILREWLGRHREEPAMQLWRGALERHASAFPHGCELLLKRRVLIRNRSPEEIAAAFASIAAVPGPVTLRQLSARVFWGDSKVLDDRGDLVASLFPELKIKDRAVLVSVFLPRSCHGTLFIENQDTYSAAAGGFPPQCAGLALVYAAGFRGAAGRIRSRGGVLLHYAGPGVAAGQPQFEQWWFDGSAPPGPCWFWGDLDFAGMQILKALRGRFEGLAAWRVGYEPMLEALRASGGHDSSTAEDPGQTDPGLTGCPFADGSLLPAIRDLGQVDQELVSR